MNPINQDPNLHQGNETIASLLEVVYVSRSDNRNYLGFLREQFLSPAILNDEKCLVYKGLGFKGLTSPDLIVTLDEYQGFKYNKDAFISTIYQHRDRLERREQRSLLLAKNRSKSHGSAPPVESTEFPKQRRFTSFESQSEAAHVGSSILSFNLLPRRNSSRIDFNLLANLGDSTSDDNAIEEDEEVSDDLDENIHDLSEKSIVQHDLLDTLQRDNIIDDDDDDNDDNDMLGEEDDDDDIDIDEDSEGKNLINSNFNDDEDVESSEEEDFDPFGQAYGYPYANKVPVIDIVVSDGEYDFDQ